MEWLRPLSLARSWQANPSLFSVRAPRADASVGGYRRCADNCEQAFGRGRASGAELRYRIPIIVVEAKAHVEELQKQLLGEEREEASWAG